MCCIQSLHLYFTDGLRAADIMKRFIAPLIIVVAALCCGMPASAQINTDQVMRIGQNALYFDDYMLSIQYFNQVIAAKPYLAQPYFLRAIAKLNLEDYIGAEADASAAINLNPYLTDAWEVRGVARQNQGKNRAAVEDYTEALRLLPRNRQMLFNKALALCEIKEYALARETFDELLRYHSGFSNAYLGRARMELEQADTIAAKADIDRALGLNPNAVNAYIMRADIAIHSGADFKTALDDIDQAIKLQPKTAGLYINRAYLRYRLDSYSGAMADYDYALTLDPFNPVARFNRALLLAEVNANDLALDDFNRVLEADPDDYRALFNRALIHKAKGNYELAVKDVTRVAEAFPDFPEARYLRGALYKAQGKLVKAEADFNAGRSLAKSLTPEVAAKYEAMAAALSGPRENSDSDAKETSPSESDRQVSKRFAALLTVENNTDLREEYNNSAIRGRVQDRNFNVDVEPMMMLSFYSSPSELRRNTYYIREVDDLNATRALRFALAITNHVPAIDETTAKRHFQSIDYYNSYFSTHKPRPVDYIGRALDFLTVRDYTNAERDADRTIALAPRLAIAYLVRAQARYGNYLLSKEHPEGGLDAISRAAMARKALSDIIEDYDQALAISPQNAVVWFNKGCVYLEMEDFALASAAFGRAIELKPDFGEAYYNRGYIELRSGNKTRGIDDLSKAGELGIVPAYNLIKRISQ